MPKDRVGREVGVAECKVVGEYHLFIRASVEAPLGSPEAVTGTSASLDALWESLNKVVETFEGTVEVFSTAKGGWVVEVQT